MTTLHSPEPWHISEKNRTHILHSDGSTIMTTGLGFSIEENVDNARRIVAAINFLEGMSQDDLEFFSKTGVPLKTYIQRVIEGLREKIIFFDEETAMAAFGKEFLAACEVTFPKDETK